MYELCLTFSQAQNQGDLTLECCEERGEATEGLFFVGPHGDAKDPDVRLGTEFVNEEEIRSKIKIMGCITGCLLGDFIGRDFAHAFESSNDIDRDEIFSRCGKVELIGIGRAEVKLWKGSPKVREEAWGETVLEEIGITKEVNGRHSDSSIQTCRLW